MEFAGDVEAKAGWTVMNANRLTTAIAFASLALAHAQPAAAQSSAGRFDVGAQVVTARSSQFEETDVGLGGRLAWRPSHWLGIEGEIDLYPRDFPDRAAISRARIEGLFGVTAGPTFDRVRPFAKVRPGFVVFREAPGPIVCILIFPPPLSCALAPGATLFALDVGGGIDVSLTRKAFVRVDAGDRAVKYPGPAFDSKRVIHDRAFFNHDFRFAAGGGWRF